MNLEVNKLSRVLGMEEVLAGRRRVWGESDGGQPLVIWGAVPDPAK